MALAARPPFDDQLTPSTSLMISALFTRPLSARAASGGDKSSDNNSPPAAAAAARRRQRRVARVLSGGVAPLSQRARFVDSLLLEAVGGKGGGGSSALFGRSGNYPRAAGGHGGRGGDVVLRAAGGGGGGGGGGRSGLAAVPRRVMGGAGGSGGKQWKQGGAGSATVVEVPVGTRVWELVPELSAGAPRPAEEDEEDEEEDEEDEDQEDDEDDDGSGDDASSDKEEEEAQGGADSYNNNDGDEEDDSLDPPLPAGDALVRLLTSGAVPLSAELKARLWTVRRLPLALFSSPSPPSSSPSSSSPADADSDAQSPDAPELPPPPASSSFVSFTRAQALEALEAQAVLLAALERAGEELVASRGGRGGRGSAGRASKPHGPASRQRESGRPGQRAVLLLRTRLLADVALVGAPNAGKSSLLRALCGARAEVGAHAFTTLRPQLGALPRRGELPPGVMMASGGQQGTGAAADNDDNDDNEGPVVTLADVPGLLEGAHEGRGRGIAFLAPLQRASVLAFVVDLSGGSTGGVGGGADEDDDGDAMTGTATAGTVPEPPERQLRVLIDEVRRFDPRLLDVDGAEGRAAAVVVANKTDAVAGGLAGARQALRALLAAAPRGWPMVPVSALEGAGLPALAEALRALVLKQRRRRRDEEEAD